MTRVLAVSSTEAERKPMTIELSTLEKGFDEYFSRIYAYALYRLQDPDAADEIASQTFTTALSRINRFDPEKGTLDAWLFGIARNVIRKYLRARRIRDWIPLDSLWSEPATSLRWVEEIASENEMLAALLPLIRNLAERERDILSLKFGGEMTNKNIAEITGQKENNIGVILYRTLHRLRDQLQENDDGQS